MRRIPPPRWDLIGLQKYVTMAVQFSRGCPYDCEFCDITIMNGRLPRVKSPEQIVAELEALLRHGWRGMVFVVDDNFIGDRKRARTLLRALVGWRERTQPPIGFLTEASLNLADDPELCALMVHAGFRKVFVGIETPCLESLAEYHKTQNERRDLVKAVKTPQRSGLHVMGGFIVGFDSDPRDIFDRQFEFIQRSGVPTAMVGLLTALPQTRLYERLRHEGRLESESNGNNTDAVLNFTPILDRDCLIRGYRTLMRRLYEPWTYYRRCRTFLATYRPGGPRLPRPPRDLLALLRSHWLLGIRHRGRTAYWLFPSTFYHFLPQHISVRGNDCQEKNIILYIMYNLTGYYYILFVSISNQVSIYLRIDPKGKGTMENEKPDELKNKISDALIIFLFKQYILIHGYLFTDFLFSSISSSRKFSVPARIMIAFP